MSEAQSKPARQWIRQLSLIVASGDNAIELSALHCVFKTQWGSVPTPPTCTVRIYNPSDATKNRLLDQKITPTSGVNVLPTTPGGVAGNSKLIVRAGYQGNFGIIFSGDLIQVREIWETPTDHCLDLFAGEGDWGHNWAFVNQSLSAGYTYDDYMDLLAQSYDKFGVNVKPLPADVPRTAAPRGRTVYGMSRDHIRRLMFTTGLGPFYKQGDLTFVPISAYLPGQEVVVNAHTGMIQVPNETNFGIQVKMLLNPSVGPHVKLRINNKSVQQTQFSPNVQEGPGNFAAGGANLAKDIDTSHDGEYVVLYAEHEGDTRGTPWYTNAICYAADPVSTGGRSNIPVTKIEPEG